MLKYNFNSFRVTKSKVAGQKASIGLNCLAPLRQLLRKESYHSNLSLTKGILFLVNLNRNMNYEGINREGLTLFGRNSAITIGAYQEVLENSDNLFGVIETNSQIPVWSFVVSEKFGTNVGNEQFLWAGCQMGKEG